MALIQSLTTIDYVILGVLLTAAILGWIRGLIEVLAGFAVFLVATFVAGQYTDRVVAYLNQTWHIQDRMVTALAGKINLPPEAYKLDIGQIPWQRGLELLQAVPIPEPLRLSLSHRVAEWSTATGSQTAADYIFQQLAGGMTTAIVFAIFATLLGAVLTLIARIMSERMNQSLLAGTTNSILGAAVLTFEAAVFIALAVGLVAPVISMYGGGILTRPLETARLTPYCLALYNALKTLIFGLGKSSIFVF